MDMYYTYLVGWKPQDRWYYGVRYSKHSDPIDLFRTYFTSSKYVKDFIDLHGRPDIVLIRKTFIDKQKAINWEHKVLRRLHVTKSERWLNQTDNKAIVCKNKERAKKACLENSRKGAAKIRGKTWEEIIGPEAAAIRRQRGSERLKILWAKGLMNSTKPVDTSKYREAALKRWKNPQQRKKLCKSMRGVQKS